MKHRVGGKSLALHDDDDVSGNQVAGTRCWRPSRTTCAKGSCQFSQCGERPFTSCVLKYDQGDACCAAQKKESFPEITDNKIQ